MLPSIVSLSVGRHSKPGLALWKCVFSLMGWYSRPQNVLAKMPFVIVQPVVQSLRSNSSPIGIGV